MNSSDIIDVLCLVFPNGQTLFTEKASLEEVKRLTTNWKETNPGSAEKWRDCLGGFIFMRMLREDYQRIPATNCSAAITADRPTQGDHP